MIKCVGAGKCFTSFANENWALKNINLEVNAGEFVSIVGRSGSGKSTLLHLIGGLDKVTEGNIYVNGNDVSKLSQKRLSEFKNKDVGFVFQSFFLEQLYTVSENVELPLLLSDCTKAEKRKRINECLDIVGMSDFAKRYVKTLSGGEKQRVSIARAIATNPTILLADEPCGNLDSSNSRTIMMLLRRLAQNGTTVLLVTHSEEDAMTTDRMITLLDGEIQP